MLKEFFYEVTQIMNSKPHCTYAYVLLFNFFDRS